MITYDILLILQYQVSTTVIEYLFVFMLALLCFCVATEFSVNKDLYKNSDVKESYRFCRRTV